MAAAKKTIILHTAVWGDWHIDALVNVTIPSLLAPGNLPHMAERHDLGYAISTRPSDQVRIEAAPSFQRLKQIIPVQMQPTLPESNEGDPCTIHHDIWRDLQDRAKSMGIFVWNMPPDVAFADGAGVTLARLLAQGKRSIIWWYARTADTVIQVLKDQHLRPEGTLTIAPRQLVDLSFQHMHPLSDAYFVDSPTFAGHHPEMLQWRAGEKAMLIRMLASANWLFEPGRFKLTERHLLDGDLNLDEIAVIDDSDDLFVASLAPVKHNAEWYEKPSPADPISIAWWWTRWNSPSNDFIAGHRIRMHTGDVPNEVWREYEQTSDRLVNRIAIRRQTFDIAKCALDARCAWAAAILTSLSEQKQRLLASLFPKQANVIVFGPTEEVARQIPDAVMTEMLAPGKSERLRRFVANHVAIEDHAPGSLISRLQASGGVLRLRSPAGPELVLAADTAGRIFVNGVPVMAPLKMLHGHLFVPIAGILDRELAQELGLAQAPAMAAAAG